MEEKTREQIKEELALEVQKIKNENLPVERQKDDSDTLELLKEKRSEVLKSEDASNLGKRIAQEGIKADFASEAAKINKQNTDTAEKEFDTKTRQRRLERLNAELDLEHKYRMSIIKQNGEHNQMLDKRKKMVEKYGYLYDWKDCVKAKDGEGKEYQVPKDFSYSKSVNKFRQFGRNLSKLDKPFLQTIKWILIIGGVVLGVFILKWTGVIG